MASEIRYPDRVYDLKLKEFDKINMREELREKIFKAIRKGDVFTLKECLKKMNEVKK